MMMMHHVMISKKARTRDVFSAHYYAYIHPSVYNPPFVDMPAAHFPHSAQALEDLQ